MIFIFSCSSPLEVDADRENNNFPNPDPNAPLLISDKYNVDFGFVNNSEITSRTITLTNISGEDYTINDFIFQNQPTIFFHEDIAFPIVIDPYDSKEIRLNSFQTVSGVFEDKLIIDGEKGPVIDLKSTLPEFDVIISGASDFKVGEEGNISVIGINNSNQQIDINRIYFSGNSNNQFKSLVSLNQRRLLNPEETINIPINFLFYQEGTYSVKLKFEIFGTGIFNAEAEIVVQINS